MMLSKTVHFSSAVGSGAFSKVIENLAPILAAYS